ncbi:LOW QUALITY PROTEIN: leucine-rich repeat and IQ domain-containing protein 1 [Thalassophryne amazonica]|uniref:LOW QUALITY PROTEIN: leucine-rich repeat and IQ domain-containing protein 1 n=1 Tax=Thalassophryne amazonica TaxID=390379 RepID=UPI001470F2DC|nr:LOW QUALITY PROTEIN: leucine-rich repeat and IQ domain-containing protein 1 [Thalassophryne amazonica]
MDDVMLSRELRSDGDNDDDEEQDSFSDHIEGVLGDIPPSLLRYFETSKSRAALCEKLILQKDEADINEDVKGSRARCDMDLLTLNEQIISEMEAEVNTSSGINCASAPNDTEALHSHDVSVCLNIEGEAAGEGYKECRKNLGLEMCSSESSLEEQRKKSAEHQMDREKRLHEEMRNEEQKRLKERNFQEELRKIMEKDNLHQAELEMMTKRAQEKLEVEKLHQQEVIKSLQQRVEEERKMREEEEEKRKEDKRKKKQEKERRKREEEKLKNAKTKKMTGEMKGNKDEDEKSKIEKIRFHKVEDEVKIDKEEEERKKEQAFIFTEENKEQVDETMMSKKEENREIEKVRCKEERQMGTKDKNRERKETKRIYEKINVKGEDRKTNDAKSGEELTCRENGEEDERKKNNIKKDDGIKKREADENSGKRDVEKKSTEWPRKQLEEEKKRKIQEEIWVQEQTRKKEEHKMQEMDEECKRREDERLIKQDAEQKKLEDIWNEEERKKIDMGIQNRHEEEGNIESKGGREKEDYETTEEENEQTKEEMAVNRRHETRLKEENEWMEEKEKKEKRGNCIKTQNREILDNERNPSQEEDNIVQTSLNTEVSRISPAEALNLNSDSECKTTGREDPVAAGSSLLPEPMEQKRLSWMKGGILWSTLYFQNRRKQKGAVRVQRGPRRTAESSSLPPLCPETVLKSSSCKSLRQMTTVTVEDVPGCNLSTLSQCPQLQSLTLRRCGLKALDGINQLSTLCYIDVQENDISFVDCESMTSLRVLRLGHNKLTSIHGLSGAENVDLLDLSHNCITRIAGLESMKRLQWLSLSHNQLISTKGLRDVHTLLHLDCSYNHLVNVEGLDHSALLSKLDLTANSLTEPPSLNNHVLLRQLNLDDNSISSLQNLTACWLPLLNVLSAAQNRITQLPSMTDFPSIRNLDLRHNCLSELNNICESLEGCPFLQEVHFTDNPLQHESDWRSALHRAVPCLRVIDDQETGSVLSPPAVHHTSLHSDSFLAFCQAQLQQTHQLEQQHHRELRNVSSPLDAIKLSCQHFAQALQLAEEHRFAHEYGDKTIINKHGAADQTTQSELLNKNGACAAVSSEPFEVMSQRNRKVHDSPILCVDNLSRMFEERGAAHRQLDTFENHTLKSTNSVAFSFHNLATMEKTASASVSNCQDVDLKNTAAVVIQQWWRNHRQKCVKINSPSFCEKGGGRGGDGVNPELGPSYTEYSILGWDYAATVIQAYWRGFALRKRLRSALAAVVSPDIDDDDTFEEANMGEFDFDEVVLEKRWTLPPSEASQQPPSLEPPEDFAGPSLYIFPLLARRTKQAWVVGEQLDSKVMRDLQGSTNRSQSPAATSVSSSHSEKSEKLMKEWGFTDPRTALLLLKRAQKMNPKRPQQKRCSDPHVCLALTRKRTSQLGPVETQNKPAQCRRNNTKVGEAEPGLDLTDKTAHLKQERSNEWLHTQTAQRHRISDREHFIPEINSDIVNRGRMQPVADPGYTECLRFLSSAVGEAEPGLDLTDKTAHLKQERSNEWLHTQTAQRHRISDREHFLPEINSDIVNRGRMQPVADPGYTECLRQTEGSWANSSLIAQSWKSKGCTHRISVRRQRQDVPSPKQVTSAPLKRERFSFRDNPVQLSVGWGSGKKRAQVHK